MQISVERVESLPSGRVAGCSQAVARECDRLRLLLEVSESVAAHRDVAALLRDLAQRLPRMVPFDVINVVLHDPVRNSMRLHALVAPGFNRARPGLEFSMDETTSKFVWENQQPVMVEDVEAEEGFPKLMAVLREDGVRSYCTVPLTSPLRRLGDMSFASGRKRTFSEAEISFLQQVAKQVAIAVENAQAYRELAEFKDKLAKEKVHLEEKVRTDHNFGEIVGNSPGLRKVLKEVETVAPTASTVLIHGETGTGEELIARALHDLGPRKGRTFVKLNCAAMPTGLLEAPRHLDGRLGACERELIEAALRATPGRVSGPNGAAKRLGLPFDPGVPDQEAWYRQVPVPPQGGGLTGGLGACPPALYACRDKTLQQVTCALPAPCYDP